MSDQQGFKTVATFNEKVQADMCVAMLGDNGIPAGVFGADGNVAALGLFGIAIFDFPFVVIYCASAPCGCVSSS